MHYKQQGKQAWLLRCKAKRQSCSDEKETWQCNPSCVENAHLGLALKRRREDIFPEDSHTVNHSLIFFFPFLISKHSSFACKSLSTQVYLSRMSMQSSSTRNQDVLCFTADDKKKTECSLLSFFQLSPCLPRSLLSVSHSREPHWGQLPDTFHTTFIELELKL